METTGLISEGLTLMVFGMGFVFIFLTVLVLATNFMSYMVNRFLPEAAAAPAVSRRPQPAAAATDDAQLMAVISAAVHQYRQRHKR